MSLHCNVEVQIPQHNKIFLYFLDSIVASIPVEETLNRYFVSKLKIVMIEVDNLGKTESLIMNKLYPHPLEKNLWKKI